MSIPLKRGRPKVNVPKDLKVTIRNLIEQHGHLGIISAYNQINKDIEYAKSHFEAFLDMKTGIVPQPTPTQAWFSAIERFKPLNQISSTIPSGLMIEESPLSFPSELRNIKYLTNPLPHPPSRHMVERAFRELGLARPRGPYRPKGKTRYLAAFPNQIWHVDIHFLGKKRSQILYAVIDDCTRLIIEWQHLSSKHASQTVKVIKRAIARYGPPHTIWSDNGGENKGEFLKAMRVRGSIMYILSPIVHTKMGKSSACGLT